jgi:hypothetical protein
MQVQRGLSHHESAGIRDGRSLKMVAGRLQAGKLSKESRINTGSGSGKRNRGTTHISLIVRIVRSVPVSSETNRDIIIKSTGIIEKTTGINESSAISSNGSRAAESMDSIGKSINGISVVEGLSTKYLEKEGIASQGRAVVNVLIGLYNPDELLHGVVEVKLDLVAGRTNRLITSELELSNQVLVRILGHSAALISIQEDIVNVQRGSNQRLIVGNGSRNRASNRVLTNRTSVGVGVAVQCGNSPQALINRTDIKVDLDLVVLKSNQGKSKTRVGAEPKLKRNV